MNTYKVWIAGSEDDAFFIEATSHERAAETFAEDTDVDVDRDQYFDDTGVCVLVREKSSDIVASFIVRGELTATFRTRPVDERHLT